MVKVWNLKKQQCVNTIEMSKDQIWTMDLHEEIEKVETEDGEDKYVSKIQIITGGSDSTLRIWKDYTAQQESEDREAELQRVQDEQKLSHLIRDEDFVEAALLAFKLNRLRDFYHVLNKIISKKDKQQDQVDSVVTDMRQFEALAKYDFSFATSKATNKALMT